MASDLLDRAFPPEQCDDAYAADWYESERESLYLVREEEWEAHARDRERPHWARMRATVFPDMYDLNGDLPDN